jgi:hypothetical protein
MLIFYHEFLKVLAFFRASSHEYANAIADNFEGKFQVMTDGARAQLSYIFTAEEFTWLSGLNRRRSAQDNSQVTPVWTLSRIL